MKFPAFSAGVHFPRQGCKQRFIKVAANERPIELSRVDTSQLRSHPTRDHLLCQGMRRQPPHGKYRLQSSVSHLLFAVGAHIFEKQIAKRNSFYAFGGCLGTGSTHKRFVLLIGAWPGQRDAPERKSGTRSLPLDQFASDCVHGDSISHVVEGGQQPDHLILSPLTENVQAPSAVFAAAPR
jgi:hypothetical protein